MFHRLKKRYHSLDRGRKIFIWFLIVVYLVSVATLIYTAFNPRPIDIEKLQEVYKEQIHISEFNEEFIQNHTIVGINQPSYDSISFFEVTTYDKEKNLLERYKVYKTVSEEWKDFDVNYQRLKNIKGAVTGIGLYVPEPNLFLSLLSSIIPTVLLIGFLLWMMRWQMGGGSKSTIQTYSTTENNRIRFDSIGGIESQKAEIIDVVDTIKNIKAFKKRGVRVPRGILLYGPPGVGKTMIAKAIAGEIGIDLFIAKGNDFKSKWYGESSKNVDKAFVKITSFLQKHEREIAILFIDEIENLLRERYSAHSVDDDIVNTFLEKIDGISGHTNIVLIGATNHINKIDTAALSRFDSVIGFDLPNQQERIDIIQKILADKQAKDKDLKIDKDTDIPLLASYTTQRSGRFIESILNKAHIESIKTKTPINTTMLMNIWEDMSIGKEKIEMVTNKIDADTVVIHELGHGIIGHLEGKRVVKLTNIPRGNALGICFSIPKTEEVLHTPENLISEVRQLFAGRIAEEVFLGKITTGASNDLEKIEHILFDYLSRYDFAYHGERLNYVIDPSMADNPIYMADVKKDIKSITQKIFQQEKEFVRTFFQQEKVQKLFWDMHKELLEKRNLYEKDFQAFLDASDIHKEYKNTVESREGEM